MKSPTPRQSNEHILRHLAVTTFLASTITGYALPTVADPFLTGGANYTIGTTNLVGQGPAATGFTGTWQPGYGTAQSPDVIATSLSYPSAPTGGGAIEYPAGGDGRAGRLLTSPYDNATSGTVYFAVMIQPDTVGFGYRAFEMHSGGFDDNANRKLQIATGEPGVANDNSNFVVRLFNNSTNGFAGDLGEGDTNVNFFVGKITFSTTGGQDEIALWRNPSDLASEAGSGTATFSKAGFDLQIDRVSLARFNAADGFKADEIRFGSSWTDVTTPVNINDTDLDGLPDSYEQALIDFNPGDAVTNLSHVKGPANFPATSDFDSDASSDAQEYARVTNPNNPDTDADGLMDGPETGTGTFVSASNTGSNPLVADTDGDSLRDGPEVNTYLTNPNLPDTDNDGERDGLEVVQGSNPLDPASKAVALGIAVVDGTRDVALYSTPLAVQTVETQFGDNGCEWNAGYAYVNAGKLYLMFTGNLNTNFEKLEIFIDSKSGGSSTFTSAGNDFANVMNGMIFDNGFAPDYHLIARRGSGKFDLDFANLATPAFASYLDVFGGFDFGSGFTGTGTNTRSIRVGYNGSNSAGILGGTAAADQVAAVAVTTGLELCIDLADLGNPTGPIKVMLLQNNNNHDFLSNQTLGGLIPTPTFGNLGNPANTKDFSSYGGDQFFSVDPSPVHLFAGNTAIRFAAKGLTTGTNYVVQESTTLASFTDVPNSGFTAAGAVQVITLPVTPGTEPRYFLRTKSVP
jgi:hypothetical protein